MFSLLYDTHNFKDAGAVQKCRLIVQIMKEAPLIESPARLVLASPSQQAANDYFKEKVQALPQAQQDVFYSLRCRTWPLPLPDVCQTDGFTCCQAGLNVSKCDPVLAPSSQYAILLLALGAVTGGTSKQAYPRLLTTCSAPMPCQKVGSCPAWAHSAGRATPDGKSSVPQPSFFSGHGQQATGAAVYQTICRINHSCTPNCHYSWEPQQENEV